MLLDGHLVIAPRQMQRTYGDPEVHSVFNVKLESELVLVSDAGAVKTTAPDLMFVNNESFRLRTCKQKDEHDQHLRSSFATNSWQEGPRIYRHHCRTSSSNA